jgi:hypothetical protein
VSSPSSEPGLRFADSVFGNCLLSLSDFQDAVTHEPRTRRFVHVALGLGVCAGAAGVALLSQKRSVQGVALLALGFAATLAYNVPEVVAGRWFSKTPPQARAVKYTLNPQGLVVVSEAAKRFHPWAELEGLSEGPATFLVWVDDKRYLVIPKRAFATPDVERAAKLFRSHLAAPRKARPAVPLWLVAALGLALLLLWNWLSPRP